MKKYFIVIILIFITFNLVGCSNQDLKLLQETNYYLVEEIDTFKNENNEMLNQIKKINKEKDGLVKEIYSSHQKNEELLKKVSKQEKTNKNLEDNLNLMTDNLNLITNKISEKNFKDKNKVNFIEKLYGKWVNDKNEYILFDKDTITVGWEDDSFFFLYTYRILDVNIGEKYIELILAEKYTEGDIESESIFELDKAIFIEDNKLKYISGYEKDNKVVTEWIREQ